MNLDLRWSRALEQSTVLKAKSYTSHLLTSGIGIILFSLLSGRTTLWDGAGYPLLPSGSYGVVFGAVMCLVALWRSRSHFRELKFTPEGGIVTLAVYFGTDWITRGYNLFQGPSIRGEVILLSIIFGLLLRYKRLSWLYILGALTPLLLIYTLLKHTQGHPIVSDDHASFIYRLTSLKENFPFIPYFSPLWNGGIDARDFFATGALNIFIICAPLIYLFDVERVYSFIVAIPLFLLLPLSLFFSTRILKLSNLSAVCALLLSLTASLLWYRWGLKYGTLGFITTCSLIPLVFSLTSKLLLPDETLTKSEAVILVIASSLMLLWSPSGVALLPLGAIACFSLPRLVRLPLFRRIGIALLLLNIPWILVFLSVSKVGKFIHSSQPSYQSMAEGTFRKTTTDISAPATPAEMPLKRGKFSFATTLTILRETAISSNPLIITLALPGIFILRGRRRNLLIATGTWLLLLGSMLAPLKPQLELDRMLVLLGILMCIPSGAALARIFTLALEKGGFQLVGASFAGGVLLTGPFVSASIVSNRSIEQFTVNSPLTENLVNQIKEHAKEGRVLFSGFILHDLNNAHVAPLVFWSGTPLMASSPFHNVWRYRQIIPEGFISRARDGGVEEYLDLYNVSAVIAHEKEWRDYFYKQPDLYSPVWREDRFTLFSRVSFPNSYILSGEASDIRQDSHSISLIPKTSELIIKFNYFPFLRARGCEIAPAPLSNDITFIKLTRCIPGTPVVVESVGAISRLWQELTK